MGLLKFAKKFFLKKCEKALAMQRRKFLEVKLLESGWLESQFYARCIEVLLISQAGFGNRRTQFTAALVASRC
jgi:hypothetical protein